MALVNSVNEFRIEGQKTAAFEIAEALDGELDALCIPVGNAGNITAYWKGFNEVGMRRGCRLPGRRARLRWCWRAGGAPRDDRQRDPDRQPGALGGGDGRDDLLRGGGQRGQRRADPRRVPVPRPQEGVFCEPASAASVAGLLAHGAGDARGSCACSPVTA